LAFWEDKTTKVVKFRQDPKKDNLPHLNLNINNKERQLCQLK